MKNKLFMYGIVAVAFAAIAYSTFFEHRENKTSVLEPGKISSYIPGKPVYLGALSTTNNVTKDQFFDALNAVSDIYCPIIESYGAECSFSGDWEDNLINAFAMRLLNEWRVVIYGGLARHPLLTLDGLTAVICHEVGHHLGGFAFKASILGDNWAATEGQSDYFAAHRCLPKLWENDHQLNASFRTQVDPVAKEACDTAWESQTRRDLCYRITMAGKSDTAMIADATGKGPLPQFLDETIQVVQDTYSGHPTPQCRLDTQFAGALCDVEFDDYVIPGKVEGHSNRSIEAEQHSEAYSCHASTGNAFGSRPSCWFKPRLEFRALRIANWSVNETRGNGNGHWEPGETARVSFSFKNDEPSKETTNVRAQIKTRLSGKWTLKSALQDAGDVSARSRSSRMDFFVTLPEATECGSLVYFKGYGYSDQGETVDSYNVPVGNVSTEDLGLVEIDEEIAGGDSFVSEVRSRSRGKVDFIELTLSLNHKWPDEVTINVVDPDGKKYPLDIRDVSGPEVNKTFTVKINKEFERGTWKLEFKNRSVYKILTLESWHLKLKSSFCQ